MDGDFFGPNAIVWKLLTLAASGLGVFVLRKVLARRKAHKRRQAADQRKLEQRMDERAFAKEQDRLSKRGARQFFEEARKDPNFGFPPLDH